MNDKVNMNNNKKDEIITIKNELKKILKELKEKNKYLEKRSWGFKTIFDNDEITQKIVF